MLRSALRTGPWDLAPFAPPSAKTAVVARRLVERYGEGEESRKSVAELETLLDRLRVVRFDWEKVEPADRLEVAWVLWSGHNPPAEHSDFLRRFLDWLDGAHHRYQWVRLATAWAAAFNRHLLSIRIVGDWLRSHLDWFPERWRILEDRFHLFSTDRTPDVLAEAFLQSDATAAQYFAAVRLPASAVRGGLGAEILGAAIGLVEAQAARQRDLPLRLCDLALEVGAFEPAAARIATRRNELQVSLAETLLLRWQFEAPPPEVKAGIFTFLLRHYGDMRVVPKRWRPLRQAATSVMHRWLTEETVAAYFRMARGCKSVERTRLAERHQFWIARLDAIKDAWLLTTTHAPRSANEIARGRLGGRPDQAALLLRIGNLTVLEVAQEAAERVWLPGNPFAPLLYRSSEYIYWPGSLAQGVDFSSGYGAENPLAWQARLAGFLDREHARKVA